MTTRASTARGQDKQHFQGRVRKWRKQWDTAGDTAKYKLLKWVPTGALRSIDRSKCWFLICQVFLLLTVRTLVPLADERTEDHANPRFPQLQPVGIHKATWDLIVFKQLNSVLHAVADCLSCPSAPQSWTFPSTSRGKG